MATTERAVMGSRRADCSWAPWTDDQVNELNAFQQSGLHPFTCGSCRDKLGTRFIRTSDGLKEQPESSHPDNDLDWTHIIVNDRMLVATPEGWRCVTCDLHQQWAWRWMVDGEWRAMVALCDTFDL